MNKVYIKGVPERGAEVIAKLESLGGKDAYLMDCNLPEYLYCINTEGEIAPIKSQEGVGIKWVGEEIFLDEPKSTELEKYDPVMASDDGKVWCPDLYYSGNQTIGTIKPGGYYMVKWRYVVPLSDFDFDNPESNIKKSIV